MSGFGYSKVEQKDICYFCKEIRELRPYGPNGERICYKCGMKNVQAAEKQADRVLFGERIEYEQ